jgi:hypothetical protein
MNGIGSLWLVNPSSAEHGSSIPAVSHSTSSTLGLNLHLELKVSIVNNLNYERQNGYNKFLTTPPFVQNADGIWHESLLSRFLMEVALAWMAGVSELGG